MDYDFLNKLNKPSFQPPAIVFKIVWLILYILMFVSFYMFLSAESNNYKTIGFWVFIIQLTLNFMWSPIFFYYKKILLAFWISILLTLTVGYMGICFYQISPVSGLLNIPYFLWLIFADILNYKLWLMNKNI